MIEYDSWSPFVKCCFGFVGTQLFNELVELACEESQAVGIHDPAAIDEERTGLTEGLALLLEDSDASEPADSAALEHELLTRSVLPERKCAVDRPSQSLLRPSSVTNRPPSQTLSSKSFDVDDSESVGPEDDDDYEDEGGKGCVVHVDDALLRTSLHDVLAMQSEADLSVMLQRFGMKTVGTKHSMVERLTHVHARLGTNPGEVPTSLLIDSDGSVVTVDSYCRDFICCHPCFG